MKTLIITSTNDATTDLLILKIGSENIFRLNYDLWYSYSFQLDKTSLTISNDFHSITESKIKKVYWRKPFTSNFSFDEKLDNYLNKEITCTFKDLYNILKASNKTVLVDPIKSANLGKLFQLRMAEAHFLVPDWTYFWNAVPSLDNDIVTKSLTSAPMDGNRFLFTTSVQIRELDKKFPWLIQTKIEADYDLTIVYVNGTLFAFTLRREKYTDWREGIGKVEQMWNYMELPKSFESRIISYMESLKLKYGRLDFLIRGQDFLFLEVNPNGQWAFLDLEDKNGLISRMANEVSPLTSNMSLCD